MNFSNPCAQSAHLGLDPFHDAGHGRPMNRSKKRFKGEMVEPPHPLNWKPLVELAGKQAEDFMLMFDVELEDGPRLTAFKHWWTRGYIHLAVDGRAFAYEYDEGDGFDSPGWYRE